MAERPRFVDTTLSCDTRDDPVARLVRDLTAEEFAAWLVDCHALDPAKEEVVATNLRSQYAFHRLQGRLDRRPLLAVLAQILGVRRSTRSLDRPARQAAC